MLRHLVLRNIVLTDSAEIAFCPHFNVITGETGAGKTAIIAAIDLSLGARADSSYIRTGCDQAVVEAAFSIDGLSHIHTLLEEAGISYNFKDEDLLVRREITKEGKNRTFINCQMVSLPLLQKIGRALIDVIDQNSHVELRKSDVQRMFLDLYGGLEDTLAAFQIAYQQEKVLLDQFQALQARNSTRQQDLDRLYFQKNEIDAVGLKAGEEEALFQRYEALSHTQTMATKLQTLLKGLSDSPSTPLMQLARLQKIADALTSHSPSLEEAAVHLREAYLAINESVHIYQSYHGKLEDNPQTYQFLETRLNAIAQLKRKYGHHFEQIETSYQQILLEIQQLEALEQTQTLLERQLITLQQHTQQSATILSEQRKKNAQKLQKELTTHLRALNMPGAILTIEVIPCTRHAAGDDSIQFWLKANAGEHPTLLQEHASGGEISRLLFAMKVILANKNKTPTLIFDEVDANVGGTTAAVLGEQFKSLGRHRQVICITHFPQVATAADAHFAVQKQEASGRTITRIIALDQEKREQELLRMLGGQHSIPHILQNITPMSV